MITLKNRSESGFTLIELLIVIAVIAVMVGVLVLQLRPQQIVQRGRDSKRLQDMKVLVDAINLALTESEITLTANGSSCTTCSSSTGTLAVDGTGYVKYTIPLGKTGLSRFVSALPTDPLNTGANVYRFGSTTADFEINTVLEYVDNATLMSTDGGNSATTYEVGSSLTIL